MIRPVMPEPRSIEAPPGTGYWCRHCEQLVTVAASSKAVHALTGSELCADGEHVAAPDTTDPVRRAGARKLTQEFPGWQVAWYYGHFRAWRTDTVTVVPVEASDEEEMRTRLGARQPWRKP
jgi:hypothetical protein